MKENSQSVSAAYFETQNSILSFKFPTFGKEADSAKKSGSKGNSHQTPSRLAKQTSSLVRSHF